MDRLTLKLGTWFFLQEPKQIKRLKCLSEIGNHWKCAKPVFRLVLAKPCSRDEDCTTTTLTRVPFMKVRCLFNT